MYSAIRQSSRQCAITTHSEIPNHRNVRVWVLFTKYLTITLQ